MSVGNLQSALVATRRDMPTLLVEQIKRHNCAIEGSNPNINWRQIVTRDRGYGARIDGCKGHLWCAEGFENWAAAGASIRGGLE